jgi:hypothetical protein
MSLAHVPKIALGKTPEKPYTVSCVVVLDPSGPPMRDSSTTPSCDMMREQYSVYMSANFLGYGTGLGELHFDPLWFFVFLIWVVVWKGLALWHSSKRNEKWWFIALLVINTAGILEIVYLFFFAKKKLTDLFPIGKIK